MLLVYDDNNTLHLRNERGLRWSYERTDRPELGFDFDYLFYNPPEDQCYELNGEAQPLSQEQLDQVKEYISLSEPPDVITLQDQHIGDLKDHINQQLDGILDDLGYHGWVEVMLVGREGSQDPYRAESRRVLEFRDWIFQTFYRLEEEIRLTVDADLLSLDAYIQKLPTIPRAEWFSRGDRPIAERLKLLADSDTLDVNEGESALGEDKRAV